MDLCSSWMTKNHNSFWTIRGIMSEQLAKADSWQWDFVFAYEKIDS